MWNWRRLLCLSGLLLLMIVSLSPRVVAADYTIAFEGDRFQVVWRINLWQNLTAFSASPTNTPILPPSLDASLVTSDLSAFSAALQTAIQTSVGTVGVLQPTVRVTSNNPTYSCSSSCPLQWLNVTVQFEAREAASVSGGVTRYDMSWKAVRIDGDLQVAGTSFNRLGEKYLLQGLLPFVQFPSSQFRSMAVKVGDTPVSNVTYQAPTRNIVLLDLSAFRTPLENWGSQLDAASQRQIWTTPVTGGFKVSAILTISEAPPARIAYIASSQVSAQITAPPGSFAKEDTLFVDTSGGLWEKVALTTILGSLGVWIGALVVEHRIVRTPWQRRRAAKR